MPSLPISALVCITAACHTLTLSRQGLRRQARPPLPSWAPRMAVCLDCFTAVQLGGFPVTRVGGDPAATASARPRLTRLDPDLLVPSGADTCYHCADHWVPLQSKVYDVQLHPDCKSMQNSCRHYFWFPSTCQVYDRYIPGCKLEICHHSFICLAYTKKIFEIIMTYTWQVNM